MMQTQGTVGIENKRLSFYVHDFGKAKAAS
jgi:hypothetical protein